MATKIVPTSALNTVTPKDCGISCYTRVRARVVPEMTAVSKPNNNPPSAPTMVPFTRAALRVPREEGEAARTDALGPEFFMPGRLADFGAGPHFRPPVPAHFLDCGDMW